jgi:glycosyltransferase involved in cell wall biosynthesis
MLHIYYLPTPEKDRWIKGDRFVRPWIRRVIRGKPRPGGVDMVLINLINGLNRINYPHTINRPLTERKNGDRILLLGRGLESLKGFETAPPFIAGIGVFTHPAEIQNFRSNYPVIAYLSASEWVNNLYVSYFGDICYVWPAGIDTHKYNPNNSKNKLRDFIIYDKLNFNRDLEVKRILEPIQTILNNQGFSWETIRYGNYKPEYYQKLLTETKYLLFLSPHESQGLACQQAMASGLPILAWDEGIERDPYYIKLGSGDLEVSSVPWFKDICGLKFRKIDEFSDCLKRFKDLDDNHQFKPNKYIEEELSLEVSTRKLLSLIEKVYEKQAI